MSDNDKLLNDFNQIAKDIREHNRIHQKKEPNSFFISEYLEKAADLFDKIADGDIQIVKHGYWIECDYKKLEHGEIEIYQNAGLCCSVCRTGFEKAKMPHKQYCPHCGAKMDGGTEDG